MKAKVFFFIALFLLSVAVSANNSSPVVKADGTFESIALDQNGQVVGKVVSTSRQAYLVYRRSDLKLIREAGSPVNVNQLSHAVALPSESVRSQVLVAVKRVTRPNYYDQDGGFHSEGFIWGNADGQERVVHAMTGRLVNDPAACFMKTTLDVFRAADPREQDVIQQVAGACFVMPYGEVKGSSFSQVPDKCLFKAHRDWEVKNKVQGSYSMAVSVAGNRVYFFNGKGIITEMNLVEFLAL